jgi:hypothetical protein
MPPAESRSGPGRLDWKARLRRPQPPEPVPPPPRPGPPGALRYVFVVTYGRSGSTLVQGLLNTIPRTLVRGENNFYILPLYRAMAAAQQVKRRYGRGSSNPTSAFYGLHALRPADFAEFTGDLVVKQLLGETPGTDLDVVGFKEVRWQRIRKAEQADFFDFMDAAFPGAQYVLNQRKFEDVAGSGFWQGREPGAVRHSVGRVEQIHEHLRSTRPDRVFDTRYELLTAQEDDDAVEKQLRGLAEFVVGSCDEALLAAMRNTLSVGHGPHPFGASRGRRKRQPQ